MKHIIEFPGISTIDAVYRPVEQFLERLGETHTSPEKLPPLDAYLLHLILEFCPRQVVVLDIVCGSGTGSTTVVCLSSPRVSKVFCAVDSVTSPERKSRLISLLEDISRQRGATPGGDVVLLEPDKPAWETMRAKSAAHELPLLLIDPSGGRIDLDRDLAAILEAHPQALIVVLSVGKLGECETAGALARICHPGSSYRLFLVREVSGALFSSGLALVSLQCNRVGPEIIARIEQLFTTNYDLLKLLENSCMRAVERPLMKKMEDDISRLTNERQQLEGEIHRLNNEHQQLEGEIHRLTNEHQQLEGGIHRLTNECQHLEKETHRLARDNQQIEAKLGRECSRPVVKALVVQSGRRIVHFGRKNRVFLAPKNSHRERFMKAIMRFQRRLRGKVA